MRPLYEPVAVSYTHLKRLSMAKYKIYHGTQPSKVYSECGFSDYSTFYRAFKKEYNLSPKEFANQSIFRVLQE